MKTQNKVSLEAENIPAKNVSANNSEVKNNAEVKNNSEVKNSAEVKNNAENAPAQNKSEQVSPILRRIDELSAEVFNLERLKVDAKDMIDNQRYLVFSKKRVTTPINLGPAEIGDLANVINLELKGKGRLSSLTVNVNQDVWYPEFNAESLSGSEIKDLTKKDAAYLKAAEQLVDQGIDPAPLLGALSPIYKGLIVPFGALRPEEILLIRRRIKSTAKPNLSEKIRSPRGSYQELASWLIQHPQASLSEVEGQARALDIYNLNLSLLKSSIRNIPHPPGLKITIFN